MRQLFDLPLEIIELVALQAAQHGFPEAAITLARSSRLFRDILLTPDSFHLWRSIFLATFDDPLVCIRYYTGAPTSFFDWKTEFGRRMQAQKVLHRLVDEEKTLASEETTAALETIVSIFHTTPPFSQPVPTDPEYLLLPPFITRPLSAVSSLQALHIWLPNAMSQYQLTSRNSTWMERNFLHRPINESDDCTSGCAYPPSLVDQYCFQPTIQPANDRQRQLFMSLIFLRGSEPINGWRANQNRWISSTPDSAKLVARVFARKKVYSLPYLSHTRAWGPFMRQDHPSSIAFAIITEDSGLHVPLIDRPHEVVPDYDYLASTRIVIEGNLRDLSGPLETPETKSSRNTRFGSTALELARIGCAPGLETLKSLHDVYADVEILENTHQEDEFRKCSFNVIDSDHLSTVGWDWAGVEGQWRRCVCWLDYRDLILQNLNQDPGVIEPLEEAARVFPMTLRVMKYSSPPKRPDDFHPPANPTFAPTELVWSLPVIHFEGDSFYDHLGQVKRRLTGTVRMLTCGAVRWSTVIYDPDSDDMRFRTEAIQVGGIGSALGYIGYWTGANHARGDPMGPIWAWKVA